MSSSNGTDQHKMLFMSNRWVNTIFPGYGLIKQRVFRQVLQECQVQMRAVGNGYSIEKFDFYQAQDQELILTLDISKISHYNNYHQVRRAIGQMCSTPIAIHNDPTFKEKDPHYITGTLFLQYARAGDGKVAVKIKKEIALLLLHVHSKLNDRRKPVPYHYTEVDTHTLDTVNHYCRSKYTYPLYALMCSYKKGFTITVAQLRRLLDVEHKYKGFDNFNRYVLKYVQKLLQDFGGKWCFNYSTIKTGRTVTSLQFAVFENKNTINVDHTWVKIQQALCGELPYFARITELQREEFNYLYTGTGYDLNAVLRKLQDLHKVFVKKRDAGERFNVFTYTRTSIHNDFPPRGPT